MASRNPPFPVSSAMVRRDRTFIASEIICNCKSRVGNRCDCSSKPPPRPTPTFIDRRCRIHSRHLSSKSPGCPAPTSSVHDFPPVSIFCLRKPLWELQTTCAPCHRSSGVMSLPPSSRACSPSPFPTQLEPHETEQQRDSDTSCIYLHRRKQNPSQLTVPASRPNISDIACELWFS